jgi:hypothetical protein
MAELQSRITGDWYEIREAAKERDTLDGYFRIPEHYQRIQIEKLEFAVEQGIVEYKRASLSPLFSILENARYASPSFESLKRQIDYAAAVLYVMLIQRLYASGDIRLSRDKKKVTGLSPEELELGNILKDIGSRIKTVPEAGKDPTIKNILIQVGLLRKERENLKRLLPTIRQENRNTFLLNYKKTATEIEDKIKRHYAALLDREMPDQQEPSPVLQAVDLSRSVKLLTEQCETVSRLRSTLFFISEEKYKIREIMVKLSKEREPFLELLSQEGQLYQEIVSRVPQELIEGDRSIARGYCREIIRYLEKQLSYTGIR